MSVNKVIIMGRLGQNPELKYLPSGTANCTFSVATSEKWKDKQGVDHEKVEWHSIVVWTKLAEICNQYLAKGRQVFIEGKLQTRSWEKDGVKHYKTEIIATSVQFIDSAKKQESEKKDETPDHSDADAPNYNPDHDSDDIPY